MTADPIMRRLHEARRDAGLSLREVAERANVNQATLSEAERGIHATTLPKLRRWASALGYDIVLAPLAGPGSTSPDRIVVRRGPHGNEIAEEYDVPLLAGDPKPLKRAGRKPTRGPGSTSPEPGPAVGRTVSEIDLTAVRLDQIEAERYRRQTLGEWPPAPTHCPEYPDCSEERFVRDLAASVRAGEPVGKFVTGCATCGTLVLTEDGTE